MIDIQDKRKCTGCNACGDVCPKNAISFESDNEGFWYPIVDKNSCINCSKCNKVCPVENKPQLVSSNDENPKCFAAINKNLYTRFDSTSGGAFSALANKVFKEGGKVGGASTDERFNARQIVIENKGDLERIRSSKYYQSDARGYYKEIKYYLDDGQKVLACGTPCQMAALRNFLGKEYSNLIIVDFICLCMPSPKIFRKYIESIENQYGSRVVITKAKSKELGWRRLTQMFILEDGRRIYQTHDNNPFQYFYMDTRTNIRPSCYDCRFKGFPRLADITIGDYWCDNQKNAKSVEFMREYDNDLGTSVIIANNSKGLDFINSCKSLIKMEEVLFDTVTKGNPALLYSVRESTINRDEFFMLADEKSFDELTDYYHSLQTLSTKTKVKKLLQRWFHIYRYLGFNAIQYMKLLSLNSVGTILFLSKPLIIPLAHTVYHFDDKHRINLNANLILGIKRIKGSKLETRFLVEGSGQLDVNGEVLISYGSDVEVFDGGHLSLGHCWMNIGCEVICSNSITIGDYVGMGRNVSIRDNNGGHYINRPYYKESRPIIIEDKVWICSNVTIMPGVKIGEGAIVGENSFVTENVPPYTMVSGNPAKVVDEDVLFSWPLV